MLFRHPVISAYLRPHGLQHTRPPCPSPSPGACTGSCPLHHWCHPAISSSDALFSFCPQSFPASGTFPMSWLFTLGCQSIGASGSAAVLPMSIQSWFPLRLTGLISLLSKGLSGVFSSTTVQRHWFFCTLPSLWSSSHNWMWPLEDHSLNHTDFFRQSNVSAFQHTSRFFITFLMRSNYLLISWLQSPSTVILEPNKRKSVTTSTFSPSIGHKVMGPDAMILVFFLIFSLKPALSPSSRGF